MIKSLNNQKYIVYKYFCQYIISSEKMVFLVFVMLGGEESL